MMQMDSSLAASTQASLDLSAPPAVQSIAVRNWIAQCVELCKPDNLYWCDGSANQRQELYDRAVKEGVLIRLNQQSEIWRQQFMLLRLEVHTRALRQIIP